MTRSQIQALLVSRYEAMRLLNVSAFTLWKWDRSGFLKPVTAGGRTAAYLLADIKRVKATSYLNRSGQDGHARRRRRAYELGFAAK